MFGLDEQIQGGERTIGRFIGENDGLAGTGRNAGIDFVRQQAFGGHHPGTAGTDDLQTFGHALGAVSDGGHRLGAAAFVHFGDAHAACRHQGCRIHPAVRTRGRDDDDARNSGHHRRHGGHVHHARKGAFAARHVAGHRLDGNVALPGPDAGLNLLEPHLPRPLRLVEPADIAHRMLDRTQHLGRHLSRGGLELGFFGANAHFPVGDAVELTRETSQRRIAIGSNRLDDGQRAGADAVHIRQRARKQCGRHRAAAAEIVEGDSAQEAFSAIRVRPARCASV